MIVFLDDIIVYSKTKEEHEEHLRLVVQVLREHIRLVMQVLREHQLYAKLSKCSFYQGKIHYLGHIIYEEGFTVDPEKIRAIIDLSTPKNVSEVRSFMGLAGYYRSFIEGFSKLAHPITSLQKKGVKFEWNSKCEDSFQILKEMITSAPILKIVDPERNFVVCMQARNSWIINARWTCDQLQV